MHSVGDMLDPRPFKTSPREWRGRDSIEPLLDPHSGQTVPGPLG